MKSYRVSISSIFCALALLLAASGSAWADKPAEFMKTVGTQLLEAARSGSPDRMADVIRRHSDLPDIGLFSLGSYRKQLPSDRRTSYYDGVARFMARYFIGQASQYPVASFEIYNPSEKAEWGHKVESQVVLRNGATYRLRWLVVPRGGTYKVRDVSILGFWMTPFQRDLFENYIRDNGGVTALLAALGS